MIFSFSQCWALHHGLTDWGGGGNPVCHFLSFHFSQLGWMNNFQHFHLCTCQGLSFLSASLAKLAHIFVFFHRFSKFLDFFYPYPLMSVSLKSALGNDDHDGMTMTTKWMVTELSV